MAKTPKTISPEARTRSKLKMTLLRMQEAAAAKKLAEDDYKTFKATAFDLMQSLGARKEAITMSNGDSYVASVISKTTTTVHADVAKDVLTTRLYNSLLADPVLDTTKLMAAIETGRITMEQADLIITTAPGTTYLDFRKGSIRTADEDA